MKKIISLTKVFMKEYYQSLPVFDSQKKKFNKKSVFFWLIVIIFFGISYTSYEIINFLVKVGQREIFLNLYLPIIVIVLSFEAMITCANIFFFSKETENVLHMPIRMIELLIAKFNSLLLILYLSEALLVAVPLVLYGMMAGANLVYYFWTIATIIIYPVVIAAFISILTFLLMKLSRFFRNKNLFQIVLTMLLLIGVFFLEVILTKSMFSIQSNNQALEQMISARDKIKNINKTFLIINPTVNMLTNPLGFKAALSFIEIFAISSCFLGTFLILGKTSYLKLILKNMISKEKTKRIDYTVDFDKKVKQNNIIKSYVLKETRQLIRNPSFFIQCIFPVIMLLISCIILVFRFYPAFIQATQDEKIKNMLEALTFNTEIACYVLVALQVMYSISNVSLTAISREGKDALFIKYIPIPLYKQFIYKNIPQFLLNLLITIVILGLIWIVAPGINILHMVMTFAISIVINLINCYLMLIVDLKRPNLDWITEEAVVKKSDNKLFQYAFMIVNILMLLYIAKIFKEINLVMALCLELAIYVLIFIIIDRCVKKWQHRLFNKII